jgi:hypothetical protein
MKRLIRLLWNCVICVGMGPAAAFALSPATDETLLCMDLYVVTGKITSAINRDCRLNSGPRPCPDQWTGRHELELTIVITGILGVHADRLVQPKYAIRVGQTVRTMLRAQVWSFREENFSATLPPSFMLPPEKLLPQGWIDAGYVGPEFIFTGAFSNLPPAQFASERAANRAPHAKAWSPDKKAWMMETMMKSPDCLTPL